VLFASMEDIDQRLADNEFIAGELFTMADISLGVRMYRYFDMDIRRPDLEHVTRWYERLTTRPAYQEFVMTSYDDLRG